MELIVTRLWFMSLQACALILIVLLARQLLKKYPKVLSYSLWALVGIRLLCLVLVESSFSLQPDFEAVSQQVFQTESTAKDVSNEVALEQEKLHSEEKELVGQYGTAGESEKIGTELIQEEPDQKETAVIGGKAQGHKAVVLDIFDTKTVLSVVYLTGVCILAAVYLVRYAFAWRKVRTAVKKEEGVWLCDRVNSPFVIGVVRPRIILPYGLEEIEEYYIVLHEKTHIRHHDSLIRNIGIFCLCLHWWNPLVWVAVRMMNKDMEMFCDEAALKNAVAGERKVYAETLLSFAARQSGFSVGLAFGESNAEQRIKNIVKDKKQSRIIIGVVVAVAALSVIALLTIPKNEGEQLPVGNIGENLTVTPVAEPTEALVSERKAVHVFSKSEMYATYPVLEWSLESTMSLGTTRTIKGDAPGTGECIWYTVMVQGVAYYWCRLIDEPEEEAELYSYAIFSEEYPLANGLTVGMSKEEVLALYPDMAVVAIEGRAYEEDSAWNLAFDSIGYPHSLSGQAENLNYQGKKYWYWQEQFDYCLLAEIDGETRQGRAMALALMMKGDKVEAITFYCRNDGAVTPTDWYVEASCPWERDVVSDWKPTSALLETVPEPGSYEEKALKAYVEALETFYYEDTLPDGTYCDTPDGFDTSENRFTICDIDADGRDELCLAYLATYTGHCGTMIYEYKPEIGSLWEEVVIPAFDTFFDNGIIAVQLSHNHGYAPRDGREFWPYTLYQYNFVSDSYEMFAEVGGWDKYHINPDTESFPAEVDKDGDGMLYFVNETPMDKADYESWFVGLFEDTGTFRLEYQQLTEENINALIRD